MALRRRSRVVLAFASAAFAAAIGGSAALLGTCGPFTDVAADSFCQLVLEIFTLGITTGTTATTYDPTANVSRLQMAAFLSRSVDGVLKRGSRRAALDQFWTTSTTSAVGLTTVGLDPQMVRCDGSDVWVANSDSNSVSRVRASDGKLLETWTGFNSPFAAFPAMGRIFVTGKTGPGFLYRIDPSQSVGPVTTIATNLGNLAQAIAFDGGRLWTSNIGASISIVTPGATLPWTVTTVTSGFASPQGIIYDGSNMWVPDNSAGTLLKLDAAGSVLQTVTVGQSPGFPAFDGTNIWVPNNDTPSVAVVRASSGALLATLTGANLTGPWAAAFDGQRVLVTENASQGVWIWKAADLSPIGFFPLGVGTLPIHAASDGVNFWITLRGTNRLARF
jgi:hypothetical protein